eukprot:gene4025-8015_t
MEKIDSLGHQSQKTGKALSKTLPCLKEETLAGKNIKRKVCEVVSPPSSEGNDSEDESVFNKESFDISNLVFPKDMERDFIIAIFELGLKNSSPKLLMRLMPELESMTLNNIKSHLQKCRVNKERSKEEFLQVYDSHINEGFNAIEAKLKCKKIKSNENNFEIHQENSPLISQAENMVSEWSGLFQEIVKEHSFVANYLQFAAREHLSPSDEESQALTIDKIATDDKSTYFLQDLDLLKQPLVPYDIPIDCTQWTSSSNDIMATHEEWSTVNAMASLKEGSYISDALLLLLIMKSLDCELQHKFFGTFWLREGTQNRITYLEFYET